MRANEFAREKRSLTIFDIDDTLFRTTAKIKVVKDGRVTRELSNQEFNNYTLQPGEDFDFGEFRSAEKFNQESQPIVPMIAKIKAILRNAGNNTVILLTARADFDDKDLFLSTFERYGIDMSRVHVHRAGNLPGDAIPAEKKAVFVRRYLDTGRYSKVRLYDDSMTNLRVFKNLEAEYPGVRFEAYFVTHEGGTRTVRESLERGSKKYDRMLLKLCKLILAGQDRDPEYYGMVAACVVDPKGRAVARVNYPSSDGRRVHAERAALDAYREKHGEVPPGSVIVTTLSPCDRTDDETAEERHGSSCTSIINDIGAHKVYCGYMDHTQGHGQHDTRHFDIEETHDPRLREMCKSFADTFLKDDSRTKTDEALQLGQRSSRADDWIKKAYAMFQPWPLNHHQRVMSWGKGDDQEIAVFELVPSMIKKDAVEIKWFQAYPQRKGIGSKALKHLQDLAREDGISLTLYPWDKGQVSQKSLMKFYKRAGFNPLRAGSKNLEWNPIDESPVSIAYTGDTGDAATTGDDNALSPVGSIPKGQRK